MDINNDYALQFLHGQPYSKNVSLKRALNHWQIARHFRELSRAKSRPDIVVCSFPTIDLSREVVRYGLKNNIPVLLDVRDLWPDIFIDMLPRYFKWIGKLLLMPLFRKTQQSFSEITGVLGVSERYVRWGLRYAHRPERWTDKVFPLGYKKLTPTANTRQALRARLSAIGIPPDALLAVFAGTFGRSYDLQTVIEAARSLWNDGVRQVFFVFCGTGENEARWRSAAEGAENVAFLGWLNAEEVSALLENAWIGLAAYSATASQGIPNKVIEYLSAGLPVICSLEGESLDLLRENDCGIGYISGNAINLARAIKCMISDPSHRELMASNARHLFEKELSADIVFSRMADHIETVSQRYSSARSA